MKRVILPALLLMCCGLGCAPQEAFMRPQKGRPVGRDGYVGSASRIPAQSAGQQTRVVLAISPLLRQTMTSGSTRKQFWRFSTALDFRNKSRDSIEFVAGSMQISSDFFGNHRPISLARIGHSSAVAGNVKIPYWHRAAFLAHWVLPAGPDIPRRPISVHWSYRYKGREYPQQTVFVPTGPGLARRSLSGVDQGMFSQGGYSSSSGVPFLMDLPIIGIFFRSSTSVSHQSFQSFDAGLKAVGTWWPLEDVTASP
jgi:hypothetical protein